MALHTGVVERSGAALAVAAAFAAACGGRPLPSPARPRPTLDGAAVDAILAGQTVDVSVAVLRGDDVVLARRAEVVYPLASLSKQLWAAAIGQLVEGGAIDVDAPLADLLPAFPDRRVTVRHLLTQTSGLGDDSDGEDDVGFTDLPPLAFEPGSFWRYSNRGALVARRVIEAVSRQSWPGYLQARIAGPLGLRSMRTCAPADGPGLPATTIDRVEFVCADALDAARWERALDQGRLLSAETVARMRTPTRLVLDGTPFALPYGWFTRIGDLGGHRAFGHTGSFPGVSVADFTFPGDGLTIAVLTRGASPPAWELLARIAREALGLPSPRDEDPTPPPELVRAVAGEYGGDGAVIRVSDHAGKVHVALGSPPWEADVHWAGGTSFIGSPAGYDPDELATFLVAGDHAVAVTWGHRLLLEGMARRRADGGHAP